MNDSASIPDLNGKQRRRRLDALLAQLPPATPNKLALTGDAADRESQPSDAPSGRLPARAPRGAVSVRATLIVGPLVVAAPLAVRELLLEADGVAGDERAVAFVLLLLAASFLAGCAWFIHSLTRLVRRRFGRAGALMPGLAVIALAAWAQTGQFGQIVVTESLALRSLLGIAFGIERLPSLVLHDRNRALLVEGTLDLGSTRALAAVLDASPGVRLVEFNSPGGLASEGLAMGALIRERGLDSMVANWCASACVLAFAGGQRRFVAPEAGIGMHGAGGSYLVGNRGDKVNVEAAVFLVKRGVDLDFVVAALNVASDDLVEVTPAEALASGLATATWNGP